MKQTIKKWEKHYRDDKGVWELICEHGIGHEPDVHGCDGCCSDKSFKKEYQTIKKEGKCGIKHIHNYFDCCSACINGEHPSEGASGHVKTCKRYKSVPPQSVSKECNCLKVCGIFPPRVGGKLSCYTLRTNDCPIHCKPEQPKWEEEFDKKFESLDIVNSNLASEYGESVEDDFEIRNKVKSFISSLLASERKDLLKELENDFEKLMPLKIAKELSRQLELYTNNSGCIICGTNPIKQRELILTLLKSKESKE